MANPSITHLDTVSSRYILKSSVTPNFSGLSWEPKDTEGVTRKLRCAWRGLIQMGRHFQGGWTVFFFSWNGLMLPLNDLFEIKYANNGMNICLYGMLGSWKEKNWPFYQTADFLMDGLPLLYGWSTMWKIDQCPHVSSFAHRNLGLESETLWFCTYFGFITDQYIHNYGNWVL